MSLPQHITYNTDSTLTLYLTSRPTTVTIEVETDAGGEVVASGTATTVNSVNTTLSSAASKGDRTVSVASATGISNGSKLALTDVPEHVLVKSVSGTTVTLRRPLLEDHASGTTCQGYTVTYTVSAADADTLFWRGRAIWMVDGAPYYTAVECTKYPLRRQATMNDIWAVHSKAHQVIPPEMDTEEALAVAHEDVLSHIAAKAPARVFTGGQEFNRAVAFAFCVNLYRDQSNERGTVLFERFSAALENELEKITQTTPRDTDQDGVVEASEQYPTSRRIRFA